MAKTIIIDTEVRGVEEAIEDIESVQSAADGVNKSKIKIDFDSEEVKQANERLIKTGDDISKVGAGIAGAFSIATGVVASFGESLGFSNEEIEKAQQQATGMIAILAGIKPVIEGGVSAFNLLGKILKTNPIFLIAGVIATVAGAFVGLDNIMQGIIGTFKTIGNGISYVWNTLKGLVSTSDNYVDVTNDIIKAQQEKAKLLTQELDQIKKNDEAAKKKYETEVKGIDFEIRKRRAAGKETEDLERKKLQLAIDRIKQEIQAEIAKYEVLKKLADQNLIDGEVSGNVADAINKKRAEKSLKDREALNEKLKDLEGDLTIFDIEQNKKKSDAWKTANDKRIEDAKKTAEELKRIEQQQLKDLGYIQKKGSDEQYEAYLLANKTKEQISFETFQALAKNSQKLNQISLDNINQELEYARQASAERLNLTASTLNLLTELNDLFGSNNEKNAKRAFEVNKALGISSAIIQTYQAAQGAYAAQIAIPTPDAPIRAAVAAGIAIASGLANVAKIASTKFEGGNSGAGAGASIGGSLSSSLPTVDTSSTPFQFPTLDNGQDNRVYVVESDISTTQNRVRVAEANASF